MKVIVSGNDRTADLGNEIRRAALVLRHGDPASVLTPENRLLAWSQTRTDEEYRAWVRRVANAGRDHDPIDVDPGHRPGPIAARLLRVRVLARKLARGWIHGTRPADTHSPIGALTLRNATCDADFTRRLIDLLKHRHHIDSHPFVIPRKPGAIGAVMARLRILLWQVLRFQTDRIATRQNAVNTALVRALEFEYDMRVCEQHELQQRIAALETRLGAIPDPPPASRTP